MHITNVVIKHYRCLLDSTVDLNPNLNVIVGDNECGKSTLLEAIHLALSGQINGRPIQGELHPYLFNSKVVSQYIAVDLSACDRVLLFSSQLNQKLVDLVKSNSVQIELRYLSKRIVPIRWSFQMPCQPLC